MPSWRGPPQGTELHERVWGAAKTEQPKDQSFLSERNKYAAHDTADGVSLSREFANCWYIDDAPAGPPFRYREAEEYRRIENHEGAYMFGSNSMLLDRWSKSVGA